MDQVLHGIPGVCCYIDDILITANSEAEHLHRLETNDLKVTESELSMANAVS